MKETYLGDGLYASYHDGAHTIRLRAPRLGGSGAAVDHEVYLEPAILLELLKFAKQFWKIDPKVLK